MQKLTKVIMYDIKKKSNSEQVILCVMSLVLGAILILYVFQISYAQSVSSSSQTLKFFRIKAQVDKTVIARGQEQTIQFSVVDAKSNQPLGGAITRATVTYPAGSPLKQFAAFTDSSGHSTISFRIESNAPVDTYSVTYKVFLQGYATESFDGSFGVVAHGVNDNNHHNNHHHNNHD
jgi:hypothetical protein